MLTTKKWGGWSTASACAVVAATLLLVGCDPPGRQNLLLGARLISQGRPADAIEPLKEAVALLATNAPACAQAWNYLGLAYHQAGKPAEAATAYQNALAKDFNLVEVRYNRGCLFLEENNLAGAINELTTYTTHRPKDARGWLHLGRAQLRARLLDASDRSLQRVIELTPTAPQAAEALNGLGMSQAIRRRPAEAFRYLNAALKQQTNYPPALLNQAVVAQQQLNDRPLALQKYRAYLDVAGANSNQVAVASLATQLEADLRPRTPPTNAPPATATQTNFAARLTNLIAAITTSPPPAQVRTAAPPVTAAPKPAPATNVVKPVAPPATPLPPTRPESSPTQRPEPVPAAPSTAKTPEPPPPSEPVSPPVEVVKLQAEPEMKPAQDVVPPTKPTPPPATPTAGAPPVPAPTSPPAEPPAAAPKPAKKSFVQKINPLNWFGSKGKKETEPEAASPVTPLPPAKPAARAETRPSPTPSVPLATATPKPVPATPATPPAPAYPRYAYLKPGTPVAGDRARATLAFTQGVQAQKSGNMTQAIAAYKEAVQADPSHFEAEYNLGVAAFDTGSWADALTAFERALAIQPADPNARLNFALSLDRANYPIDAANELETLLAGNPGSVDAHLTLAGLYAQKLGDKARARTHYTKVLELDPRHPQAAAIRRWLANNRAP